MITSKHISLLVVAIMVSCHSYGSIAEYSVKSLGLKVANITINNTPGRVIVTAKSSGNSPIFPKLNNSYTIDLDNLLRPVTYTRKINQKTVQDEFVVNYNRTENQASMHRKSTGTTSSYYANPNSRDVYSFMALLLSGKANQNKYPIDANGSAWQATVNSRSIEDVKTKFKTFNATRYDISFNPLSKTATPYVDMVTHNFVNEDTKLSIWVADDGLAVKAAVKKRGLSMNWELTGYQQ